MKKIFKMVDLAHFEWGSLKWAKYEKHTLNKLI
jgi:hypothetical protein